MAFLASIQLIAERVLNSIPEGLLIALFAWLLLRIVGRQNSGTRFAIWFSALVAIALIPFVPALRLGGSMARAVHAEVMLPGSWALRIFAGWALVAFVAAARLALGLWRLRSLRDDAQPLTDVDPVLLATIDQCRAVRQVEVCSSRKVRVPTAVGFFRPIVLIPEWAAHELSPIELQAIVLHEFAHLRRRDDWTNLFQKIVRTMLFFHPAVLWIEQRLTLEREMACDDAVLAEMQNPHVYARCLVSLAEKSLVQRGIAVTQAAISRAKDTTLRVAQILDLERPKATRVFAPAVAASVLGFVGVGLVVLPNAPRLIAFEKTHAIQAPAVAQLAMEEPAPQVSKSMVIEAAAHVDRSKPAPAKVHAIKRPESPAREAHEVLVKHRAVPSRPLVVQASAKRAPSPPAQFVVFTQSTEYFRQGNAIVSYSVWRITLVTAQPASSKLPNQT